MVPPSIVPRIPREMMRTNSKGCPWMGVMLTLEEACKDFLPLANEVAGR